MNKREELEALAKAVHPFCYEILEYVLDAKQSITTVTNEYNYCLRRIHEISAEIRAARKKLSDVKEKEMEARKILKERYNFDVDALDVAQEV